ncbi:hypothetical protein [Halarchaeum sp. P4]|uniref:ADDT family thymidine hypermodification transferase n=1 Tax=Halarchaeum sp. P4 TaxID=3421639 RepID=UPI003EBAD044
MSMASPRNYSTLHDAPEGSKFAYYAKDIDLFEAEHFSTLAEWLDDRGYSLDSEIAYFATFAYIAGGWTRDTPRALIDGHGIESMADAIEAAKSGKLDDFSEYDTRHSHRKVNASRVEESFRSLDSFSVAGQPVSSFEEFFEILEQYRSDIEDEDQAAHETFVTAWDSLESVSYFGPLTGYDWLEVVAFVHGHEEFTPPTMRPRYLNTGSNPPKGFEEVFGIGLDHEDAEHCVRLLEEFALEELDKEMPSAMFDMESALCVFYKDIGDIEMADSDTIDPDCYPNRKDDCY